MEEPLGNVVVGEEIINRGLIIGGDKKQLKNSTYDLRIGKIVAHGVKHSSSDRLGEDEAYYMEPRQAVSIISREEFCMPATVTGIATLRTAMTKQGLLALNVGIIDPHYNGPVGTTLLNFSDRKVAIRVGESFFRILFLERSDVDQWKPKTAESQERLQYQKKVTDDAYLKFSQSFLNIEEFSKKWYSNLGLKIVASMLTRWSWQSLVFWIGLAFFFYPHLKLIESKVLIPHGIFIDEIIHNIFSKLFGWLFERPTQQ